MLAERSTLAELEQRVTHVYQLLMRREPYQNIKQYAQLAWGCSDRTTDRYIAKARQRISEEAKTARANIMDEQLVLIRNLYRNAYIEKKWGLCRMLLQDEAALLGLQAAKYTTVEATQKLVDDGALPIEVLERVSNRVAAFQEGLKSDFRGNDGATVSAEDDFDLAA